MRKIFPILFGSAVMMISACQPKQEETEHANSAKPANVFYVRTAAISVNGLQDAIHLTGMIQSDTEAKPSFKTGGVIAKTFVREGDAVRKGQLLAKLNLTEIDAQANQAKLALEKAQRDLQRMTNLYADSIVTLEQLQNARTAVDLATKSVEMAQFNVSTSEVRSPIHGKVVKQFLHEGEVTGPGTPVYYVMGVETSDWKIVAGVTDKDFSRIKKGGKATISLDAYPGLFLEGKVERLSDVANPASGTFDVEIALPSKDNRVAAGMLAHADILPAKTGDFPIIPIEALVSSNGQSGVVYVPKDSFAEKRIIQIRQFNGETIAVQSGLEGISEVITAGSGFLENGDRIRIEK